MTIKRRRGRPPGTGKNDVPYLTQVADLMAADPKLRPTKAMKRVIAKSKARPETNETLLRRLQVKWNRMGDALLAAAKKRAEPKPVSNGDSYPTLQRTMATCFKVNAAMRAAHVFTESPAMKAMRIMEKVNHFQNWPKSPYPRAMRGFF